MGKSGQAAYRFLKAKGYTVAGIDSDEKVAANLAKEGWNVGTYTNLDHYDTVVVSPGVSPSDKWYAEAVAKKKQILGEAEVAFQESEQTCVAITGTNGKTTVTLLVAHILNECGRKARALGNVGEPLTDYFIHPDPEEIVVAELSSYQLETMGSQVFDAGVILNITPDHLDRYSSMEEYARAKCRLELCMKKPDSLYVNMQILKEYGPMLKSNYRTFGSHSGAYFWTDKSVVKELEKVEYFLPDEYRSLGVHESENVVAAWAICKELGVGKENFVVALKSFAKPSHRIEFVTDIEGVLYYDDSKGTNIDATIKAVQSMPGPVILIAGGVDKGASYYPWKEVFGKKVKRILALGQAAEKICRELQNDFPVMIVPTLDDAVELASLEAKKGECILLSPGCSSFDMFRDYAHRGEEFKRCVHDLIERRKKE
jgi:UDP-N-acetylmuramoylalanine--D-glutamate ligase